MSKRKIIGVTVDTGGGGSQILIRASGVNRDTLRILTVNPATNAQYTATEIAALAVTRSIVLIAKDAKTEGTREGVFRYYRSVTTNNAFEYLEFTGHYKNLESGKWVPATAKIGTDNLVTLTDEEWEPTGSGGAITPGIENAGKLLYVDESGNGAFLPLGDGLEIANGRLCIIDGNGLGSYAASLLIKVLRSAVYNTDQSAYIDALEAAVQGGAVPDLPDIPDTPDVPDTPDDSDYTAIPLTVVKGAVTRVDGSKMTYDTTSSAAAIRATTNPIAFYVESGKTYKISLSDYSTYGIGLQTFTYSVKDTDFTVDAGTQRIINGDFTRLTTSGWKREEIVYTADGTADIITVMAAKGSTHDEELTDEDIAALNEMLTVKTNADMPDEPVLPDNPDTPDNPVNPDAETIPLSVVHGGSARVDGQKLTYDPSVTSRGATNPLAFYVEEGKTYTVSLSSYENYGFYPQGLSYSTSGTDFTVVDGTEKIFHGDFTRTLAPGWQYADYTFTADGTYQVIALQFRNIANTALTADDIAALNKMLTVKTNADISDEPAEAITFTQTGENSVTVSGVVFEQQEDGTVLWRGTTFTTGDGDAVIVS